MESFAALLDKFRDHRIRTGCFQQFDARSPAGSMATLTFSGVHGFARAGRESELLFIEPERRVKRSDSDAEMVNVEVV